MALEWNEKEQKANIVGKLRGRYLPRKLVHAVYPYKFLEQVVEKGLVKFFSDIQEQIENLARAP